VHRNEEGYRRIQGIRVRIEPEVTEEDVARMRRCLEIFEDYCVVTESVRGGIDVVAEVRPRIISPVLTMS
jgi:organic hydroperoxide reductase OsmC/OhrA